MSLKYTLEKINSFDCVIEIYGLGSVVFLFFLTSLVKQNFSLVFHYDNEIIFPSHLQILILFVFRHKANQGFFRNLVFLNLYCEI